MSTTYTSTDQLIGKISFLEFTYQEELAGLSGKEWH